MILGVDVEVIRSVRGGGGGGPDWAECHVILSVSSLDLVTAGLNSQEQGARLSGANTGTLSLYRGETYTFPLTSKQLAVNQHPAVGCSPLG